MQLDHHQIKTYYIVFDVLLVPITCVLHYYNIHVPISTAYLLGLYTRILHRAYYLIYQDDPMDANYILPNSSWFASWFSVVCQGPKQTFTHLKSVRNINCNSYYLLVLLQ